MTSENDQPASTQEPETRSISVSPEDMRKTRRGVSGVFYGLELFAFVILAGIAILTLSTQYPMLREYIGTYAIAAPWLIILASLIGVGGRIMCLSTPPALASTWTIAVAVIFDVVSMGWQLASIFAPDFIAKLTPNLGVAALAIMSGTIVSFVSVIFATTFFLFFLRQVALNLNDTKFASQCLGVVVLQFLVLGLLFATPFSNDRLIIGLMILVCGLLWLMWLARYSRVLYNIRILLANTTD